MRIEGEAVYARVVLNGEPIGMVRLPTPAHLRWLRERIQTLNQEKMDL